MMEISKNNHLLINPKNRISCMTKITPNILEYIFKFIPFKGNELQTNKNLILTSRIFYEAMWIGENDNTFTDKLYNSYMIPKCGDQNYHCDRIDCEGCNLVSNGYGRSNSCYYGYYC